MDAIRELVEKALEKKRVLSQMKAELRAQVFLAIDEEESSSGYEGLAAKTQNPQRDSLLTSDEGQLLVALVREFLEWAGLEFTVKVFEPEVGPVAQYHGRMGLSKQLGINADVAPQAPLLLTVLKQFQSKAPGDSKDHSVSTKTQPQPTARPPQHSYPAPRPSKGSEQSYDENFEIESDEGLAGAEIAAEEEEEDYSVTLAKNNPSQADGNSSGPVATNQPPAAHQPHMHSDRTSSSSNNNNNNNGGRQQQQASAGHYDEGMDLSASSLSTSGFMASRLRRPKARGQDASGGGYSDQSDDLMLSDDHSGNISHGLGLAPPAQGRGSYHDSDAGGLSFSGELPQHPDEGDSGDLSRSSRSREPLGPQRPSPLGKPASSRGPPPLAPMGGASKLNSLSGPTSTNIPRVLSPPSKQGDQLKEELYKSGLIPPKLEPNPEQAHSEHSANGNSRQEGHSNKDGQSSATASSRRSSADDMGHHQGSEKGGQSVHEEEEPEALGSPEPSSGHSSNQNQSSKHSSRHSSGGNNNQKPYDESKAVSMDLRDTGLSASDQSGDFDTGTLPLMGLDMEETAEWGS